MRVLVLDGNENQAVAAVRSLGRAGHDVWVGADARWSKAGWSRLAAGRFTYPSPQLDTEQFVSAIVADIATHPGTLILPMTERTTLPVSLARDRIAAAGGLFVLPAHANVMRAFDKQETTRLGAALGIAVPDTATIESDGDAAAIAPGLRYPVVLKPRRSNEPTLGALRPTGAPMYARSAGELMAAWRIMGRRCRAALVQEFIDGAGIGYFALFNHGQLRAEFAHRRLRDVRPSGSGSALRVSTAIDARVRQSALALLDALQWHGVAMVEFRQRADGTPVFLEVNGRFWNSLALAVHAGVDFPRLLADLAEHGDTVAPAVYKQGVECRWWLGDLRHLAEVWRGAPAGYPARFPGRLRTLVNVMTPRPGACHDNFELADPLPEVGDWVDFLVRRLPRGARGAATSRVWNAKGSPSHP